MTARPDDHRFSPRLPWADAVSVGVDVADNLKKQGAFIPSIRPGKATADYIDGVLTRLTGHTLATGKQFHVLWPRDAQLSRAALDVRDWLVGQNRS